jgi:hypothetical protein
MIKVRKHMIVGLIAIAASTSLFLTNTYAQTSTMSDAQIAQIRTSCVSAKNTLSQLRASDALLRVNRGQLYLSMSTKLMNAFNDRASSNHYDISGLQSVTQNYDAMTTSFIADYKVYSEQLSNTIAIDCTKDPESFYNAVALARTQRSQVHVDVTRLHQYIDDYSTVFSVFVSSELAGK